MHNSRTRMRRGEGDQLDPMRLLLSDVGRFSVAGGRRLRAYQAECAQAVARSVLRGQGKVFTVMFARQMGKNETSAQLEAYLLALYAGRGGSIVKAAPSFKPQIITSMLRLRETLERSPTTSSRWKPAFGYMVSVGRASVTFLSADRHANVVGATASLLLEIDEAQDVDGEKYDRDFRPMASSTNATTVLYGTAWSPDSILERQRRLNLEQQRVTGERLHFEYDWRTLAITNQAYGDFVAGEIARLGLDHPTIQTQYLLKTISDAGRLFSEGQLQALRGQHPWEDEPVTGTQYVAGIDIAGADEEAEDARSRGYPLGVSPARDSTVVTIAAVSRDGDGSPVARVVHHVWWTGRDQVWQYHNLLTLWERWRFARVCVDASGIGAGLAAFLGDKHAERVERFVFTAPSKSKLAYAMLAMTNTGRLTLYKEEKLPESREFWQEARACRYRLRAGEQLAWEVPPGEGHDDFVVSLALCCRAAEELAPRAAGMLLRPPWDGEGRGW